MPIHQASQNGPSISYRHRHGLIPASCITIINIITYRYNYNMQMGETNTRGRPQRRRWPTNHINYYWVFWSPVWYWVRLGLVGDWTENSRARKRERKLAHPMGINQFKWLIDYGQSDKIFGRCVYRITIFRSHPNTIFFVCRPVDVQTLKAFVSLQWLYLSGK